MHNASLGALWTDHLSCTVQQSDPAILLNHGNDFLHYEDDWFIVKYRPEAYNFVYYKGNNDAWKGYGEPVASSSSLVCVQS